MYDLKYFILSLRCLSGKLGINYKLRAKLKKNFKKNLIKQ